MTKKPASQKTPAQLIRDNRKHGESRIAQAKRLGIPETSLRQYERDDRLPPNPHMRTALLVALGVA